MASTENDKTVKFVSDCVLQIWHLGDVPDACITFVAGLKRALTYTDQAYLIDDMSIIIDLLEEHEKLGTLPSTPEGLQAIVSQYYGEKQ